MHELGVVLEVVQVVEKFARENQVEKIETVVIQIGELSSMIPKYIQEVYPVAVDETMLEGSKLKIEILTANGKCEECGTIFPMVPQDGICPKCQSTNCELLGGREFYIKEIICY
ncbi:MAG: hydrogenase maturation nickel metallochaperone HypA [Lachnospiraceae bacterium]